MPRDIDEDLIEATIRRVAESKAARDDSPTAPSPDESEPVPDVLRGHDADASAVESSAGADEDAIEATIRRVAEAKAARDAVGEDADGSGSDSTDGEAGVEADEAKSLDKLRFDDHGRSGPRRFSAATAGGVVKSPWSQFRPTDDEDDTESTDEPPVLAPDAILTTADVEQPAGEGDAPSEAVHHEIEAAPAAPISRIEHAPAMRFAPAAIAEPSGSAEPSLADISAKLDTAIALLEKLSAGPSRSPAAGDWTGAGRVVTLGGPPRPGLRDPRAATAEQLLPDEIDTRPLPPPPPPLHVEPKRGLELLPRTYRITVEDKRRGVDLVPLHRALLGMESVKDMSLLSYNNGVAIVALDTGGDLDPDALRAAVSRAMARDAKVEVHNESTMVIKLAED